VGSDPLPINLKYCDVTDESYDLDRNGEVDANDLLQLIEDIKAGIDSPETDFNCDGKTDIEDVMLMARKWVLVLQP